MGLGEVAGVWQERMRGLCLHQLVAALGDDDGLGDAVLHAAPIGVDEELNKAESAFESCGTVSEGSLDRMPEGEVSVDEGDDADLEDSFAGAAAFAPPGEQAKVEDGDDDVGGFFDEFRVGFLAWRGILLVDFDHSGREDDVGAGRNGTAVCFAPPEIAPHASEQDGHQRDADKDPIEQEGEGAPLEAGEFNAVEFLQPLGFASGEISHGLDSTGCAVNRNAVCYADVEPPRRRHV